MGRRRVLRALASMAGLGATLFALFAVFAPAARPAAYPDHVIRLIVPFAAGGANDIVARLIQPLLERALGQPIIVDNRPAASGVVGTDMVAKAQPDGYTLLMAFTTHTVNPAVNAKLPYDTERDLAPVILVGKSPLLFLVNEKVAAKTLPEFVALAKAEPGKLNYATPGSTSQAHLLVALWSKRAGIDMQHIAYRGGAPAVLGTVTGEAQMTLMSPVASLSQIRAGTLRAIATGGLARDPLFPDLPTMAESGFPDFEAAAWVGLFATAGTPAPIIARLNAEVNRIIRDPQILARFKEEGISPAGGTPEQFGAFISSEIKRWREAAKIAGITAE
jgi:tripartite-type tricarboxylate transporter receptor subunit TctC